LVRSIRLDFLGRCLFLVKTFVSGGWICFDFLGFSRPNRDFSIGYEDKTKQIFSRRPWGRSKGDNAAENLAKGRGLFMARA
jgi:hypothetical protein